MEENKDMESKVEQVDTGQEKKGTVVLFGHEFDKKKAVMAGLGGLLAVCLIGGSAWYAAAQKPEPKEPAPIEQVEKTERHIIQIGAKADGWVKGESSPVIAHIVNKEQKVDYYHAYDANAPHALDVPAEGEYEVSFISPVDKDGSIYEVPKAAKVKSVAEDKDKTAKADLPFEFKPIAADKADADTLTGVVKSVTDAVKKGDETLTGGKGTKVIELVKANVKANTNADGEKVDEESKKADGDAAESTGGTTDTQPDNGGSSDSAGNSDSGGSGSQGHGGSNSNSGNGGGQTKPQHTHNWVAQTTTVHHEAQYQTIHHDAVYKTVCICNGCNAQFNSDNDWGAHSESQLLAGHYECGSYKPSNIVVQDAWDETIEVSPAWDETITTGYLCSGCGASK